MNNYIFPFLWLRNQSEDVLRKEIEMIDECGIKAVCLESRPHPDFAGDGWWHDFNIVLEEAHNRGMKIWILDDAHFPTGQANGKIPTKHPELARKYLMMQHTDCVGPVYNASLDVELFMTKAFTWMDFGKPINKPLQDGHKLISITAYPIIENDVLGKDGIDLTDAVENGRVTFDLPAGVWRICVSFETYDFGARNEYINYIDEKSVRVLIDEIYELHYEHYKEEFGSTIAGFFSDEPGFYNVDDFQMNDAIGRKKMALPWSDELFELFETEGSNWRKQAPLLWFDCEKEAESALIRHRYMDKVSRLYKKNFSNQLGSWCEDHGVEYIGHVIEDNGEHCRLGCGTGHYFRAMAGQHMAGIDTIGGQIIPGNPYASRHGVAYVASGKFNHFGIAKLGASAAQIDPKKKGRLMCEAFGAYGWNFGVRSMKWLVDYLLVQGVNHFVPHAFSMADYPDDDCPPHFYARGNNPQFPYFAEVMKYTNRMCDLLNGGQNVPVVGLLYPAEHDWMTECMPIEVPGQIFQESQIDYEILPMDVFTDRAYYDARLEEHGLVVNNRRMKAFFIPETRIIDETVADFVKEAVESGLKVIFINQKPEVVALTDGSGFIGAESYLEGCETLLLSEIPSYCKEQGLYDIFLETPNKNLLYHHYLAEEELYFLFNTSLSETVHAKVEIKTSEKLFAYDCMNDVYRAYKTETKDGKTVLEIELTPYESLILRTNHAGKNVESERTLLSMNSQEDISEGWKVAAAKSLEYPAFEQEELWEKLVPYSSKNFMFSGIMRYRKTIEIREKASRILFCPQHVYEAAEVFVNGKSAGKQVTPEYVWDITSLCHEGKNEVIVEVANTPTRDSLHNPGIFGPVREILEPSGMFGTILLKYYK